MQKVYVLNNSFECISTTSVKRALFLIREGMADVVKWSDRIVRTARMAIRIPLIIKICRYVRAYGRALKYNNRFVWERDDYTCQYCGVRITTKADLTTDHVHPDSKGGREVYENMVTCCRKCNSRKDNKTCEEARMWPARKPFRPQMSRSMSRIADEARRILAVMDKPEASDARMDAG